MKKWMLWLLVCICMFTMGITVLAEPTSFPGPAGEGETTTTVAAPTETTDTTETTGYTETTNTTETTVTIEPPTTTEPVAEALRVIITLSMPNSNTVLAEVQDINGDPVIGATLELDVDGNIYQRITNDNGEARLPVAMTPSAVYCKMEDYNNGTQTYIGGTTQMTFSPVVTAIPTTVPTTAPSTTVSTTTLRTTSARLTGSPSFTTSAADVVTTTALLETTTTTEDAGEPVTRRVSAFPQALAIGLMSIGGLLLVAAIVLVVLFIVRRPADESEDAAERVTNEPDAAVSPEETAEGSAVEEQPQTPVSLNDLFNNKND